MGFGQNETFEGITLGSDQQKSSIMKRIVCFNSKRNQIYSKSPIMNQLVSQTIIEPNSTGATISRLIDRKHISCQVFPERFAAFLCNF